MHVLIRALVAFAAAVSLPALVWVTTGSATRTTSSVQPNSESLPRAESRADIVGRAGCSATACHGSSSTPALTGNEAASCWVSSSTHFTACDPHARAYQSLTGPTADGIMRRLRSTNAATEDTRCLACHTNPTLVERRGEEFARFRAEGVSCEACHGNAGKWLGEHTSWNAKERIAASERTGFARLDELETRTMLCAGCHVGAPAGPGVPLRDVNHDMIAAGHPRMNFEFAEYQRRLTPHWQEKDRSRDPAVPREAGSDAKMWLLGRVASAEAACRLLADRATRSPWPEFAESNCFACHHELAPAGWRHGTSASWQTLWPLTQDKEFQPIHELWRSKVPHAETVRVQALVAAEQLRERRRIIGKFDNRAAARDALQSFDGVVSERLDWDEACQVLYGLAALERTQLALAPRTRVHPEFALTFEKLLLPRAANSPRGYDPALVRRDLDGLSRAVYLGLKNELK